MSDDGMILDVIKGKSEAFIIFEAYQMGLTKPRVGVRIQSVGWNEAVAFVREYWRHPLAEKETLTRVMIDKIGNVTVRLGAGPSIRIGRDPAERIGALAKIIPLLNQGDRSKIQYIDLQYDDVIIKRKG